MGSDQQVQVHETALRWLARREYAENELIRKLSQRLGDEIEDPHLIKDVVETLKAEGLLSDQRYAASLARVRADQGKGPLILRAEMRQSGVEPGLIEAALDAIDWFKVAVGVYHKRYQASRIESYKEWAKRAAFLQRRGFTSEQVRSAVGEFESVT
ncbi:MAG: regulatory protein RecX [Arenicellales bacterium]|jgi:regulatory protein|nr:hypothetical protein [Acidiferrobacteraceae bacterium]MDP6124011.1 regulatory protein RecX [Arenicellales bacterium]MDP6289107.1 regulatory protein RecX [Arenicellales bacterium]MDP7154744.1 regulatory protein RecX [Arenicellales bacterium]MDP7284381.1 regulatory protein RecX [Arenicellales bacterium]|tara:strand:- start:282 stop:749 length:468 start_codon:yes stop_codon:yes gene_type:complete